MYLAANYIHPAPHRGCCTMDGVRRWQTRFSTFPGHTQGGEGAARARAGTP